MFGGKERRGDRCEWDQRGWGAALLRSAAAAGAIAALAGCVAQGGVKMLSAEESARDPGFVAADAASEALVISFNQTAPPALGPNSPDRRPTAEELAAAQAAAEDAAARAAAAQAAAAPAPQPVAKPVVAPRATASAPFNPQSYPSSVDCRTVEVYDNQTKRLSRDVPDAFRKFHGAWGKGAWDGKLCHELIVERINADGSVTVLDLQGWYTPWDRWPSAFRRQGQIGDDGVLRVSLGRLGRSEYRVEGGIIYADYYWGGGVAKATLYPN